jgi:hypothetical protein
MPSQQQQGRPMSSFPSDSYQPAHLLFQKQDQMPGGNVNEPEAFDLFGRSRNVAGMPPSDHNNNMDPSSSYLFQGQRPPHRQNSDSQLPPHLYAEQQQHLGARRNSTGGAPAMMPRQQGAGGMPADSDIVDSLFGPVGGGGGGGDQSLLSGIQGLNLNNNAPGGAPPGWSSSIAGWASENANNAGGAAQGPPQHSNHGLTSGGMLNGAQHEQQQQQPGQQSRFNWG